MVMSDIHWLAGLLEGEGCFTVQINARPEIQVGMRDEDIIKRIRDLMYPNGNYQSVVPKNENHSIIYQFRITGNLAIQWMLTLYILLGNRRREKIKEIIEVWKTVDPKKYLGIQREKEYRDKLQKLIELSNKGG